MSGKGDWRESVRAAQVFIWIVFVAAVCGLLVVLDKVLEARG